MEKQFEILDCTLRDGGYSNDWHFDKVAASKLFSLSEKNGCDYFEVGFRFTAQDSFRALGPFAFSKSRILAELKGVKETRDLKIGFMINASDYLGLSMEQLEKLIPKRGHGSFNSASYDFVRVAARFEVALEALNLCQTLVHFGYQVMINLMQAHNVSEGDLKNFSTKVEMIAGKQSNGYLSHVYLADTMGSMKPDEVKRKVHTLVENTNLEIGFHGHDNLRLALANSLAAVEAGARTIDGTLTGIGRGIGNTRVELLYLARDYQVEIGHVAELMTHGAGKFTDNKEAYLEESGYALSGYLKVHPNYVASILQNGERHFEQLPEVFPKLSDSEKASYSEFGADLSSIWYSKDKEIKEKNEEQMDEESFLLVAPGESSVRYKEDLINFVKETNTTMGILSQNQDFPSDIVSYYFSSYPLTFLTGQFGNRFDCKVVAPFCSIPEKYRDLVDPQSRIEFGLRVERNSFSATRDYLIAPTSRVYLFAMAFLASHGIGTIRLAGFDGYSGADPRNNEFMESIRLLKEHYPNLTILSLTPTKYDLEIGQLFL